MICSVRGVTIRYSPLCNGSLIKNTSVWIKPQGKNPAADSGDSKVHNMHI